MWSMLRHVAGAKLYRFLAEYVRCEWIWESYVGTDTDGGPSFYFRPFILTEGTKYAFTKASVWIILLIEKGPLPL